MALLRDSPYIWVTWLTKFLAGENSCEQGCLVPVPTRRMELGDSYKERPVHRRGRAGQLSIGDKGNKTLVGQFNFGDFAHFYIGANRGIRYGWQNVGNGLGVGLAPVCAGVLWDVTGTYAASLLMSLGFSLMGLFSVTARTPL